MIPSGTSLPARTLATVRILPSPPPTTTASSSPPTTRCRVRSAAERSSAPGRNSMTAEIPCLSNADIRAPRSLLSPWRSMVPADAFKSATTLSRFSNHGRGPSCRRVNQNASTAREPLWAAVTTVRAVRPDLYFRATPSVPSIPWPRLHQCTNLREHRSDSEHRGKFGSYQ